MPFFLSHMQQPFLFLLFCIHGVIDSRLFPRITLSAFRWTQLIDVESKTQQSWEIRTETNARGFLESRGAELRWGVFCTQNFSSHFWARMQIKKVFDIQQMVNWSGNLTYWFFKNCILGSFESRYNNYYFDFQDIQWKLNLIISTSKFSNTKANSVLKYAVFELLKNHPIKH